MHKMAARIHLASPMDQLLRDSTVATLAIVAPLSFSPPKFNPNHLYKRNFNNFKLFIIWLHALKQFRTKSIGMVQFLRCIRGFFQKAILRCQ